MAFSWHWERMCWRHPGNPRYNLCFQAVPYTVVLFDHLPRFFYALADSRLYRAVPSSFAKVSVASSKYVCLACATLKHKRGGHATRSRLKLRTLSNNRCRGASKNTKDFNAVGARAPAHRYFGEKRGYKARQPSTHREIGKSARVDALGKPEIGKTRKGALLKKRANLETGFRKWCRARHTTTKENKQRCRRTCNTKQCGEVCLERQARRRCPSCSSATDLRATPPESHCAWRGGGARWLVLDHGGGGGAATSTATTHGCGNCRSRARSLEAAAASVPPNTRGAHTKAPSGGSPSSSPSQGLLATRSARQRMPRKGGASWPEVRTDADERVAVPGCAPDEGDPGQASSSMSCRAHGLIKEHPCTDVAADCSDAVFAAASCSFWTRWDTLPFCVRVPSRSITLLSFPRECDGQKAWPITLLSPVHSRHGMAVSMVDYS